MADAGARKRALGEGEGEAAPKRVKLGFTFGGSKLKADDKATETAAEKSERKKAKKERKEKKRLKKLEKERAAAAGEAAGAAAGAAAPVLDLEPDDDDTMLEAESLPTGGVDVTAAFTPMQLRRYEKFRRSSFNRRKTKQFVQDVSQQRGCSDKVAIVTLGVAKILVGEIVEEARQVAVAWGEAGALQPRHVQEAYRRLAKTGAFPKRRLPRMLRR